MEKTPTQSNTEAKFKELKQRLVILEEEARQESIKPDGTMESWESKQKKVKDLEKEIERIKESSPAIRLNAEIEELEWRLDTTEKKAKEDGEEYRQRNLEKIEKIRAEIEQKKESSKEQGEKGTERVEKSDGGPEDVVDAKNAGEILNTKTEEAAGEVEVEVKTTEQKLKPSETVTYEDVMEKRAEEAAQSPEVEKKSETVTYEDILKERAATAKGKQAEPKVEAEEVKQMWTTEDKTLSAIFDQVRMGGVEAKKIKEARVESGLRQNSLDRIREDFASLKPEDPKYAKLKKDYESQIGFAKYNLIKNRQSTLESKGLLIRETGEYKKLTSEEVQDELYKYAEDVLVPHFTVVEAAKIQAARSEANPSLLEKMKDNKFSKLAYGAVDMYRKANWKQKLALSVGLLGVGVVAGATGGTIGLALAGIVTGGKGLQRFLSGAGTAVATEALIQRSQQKWMEKEGWGKNRHEYIAKQIASLRESTKKGAVLSEAEVEKSLGEREKREKDNEINRAILAGLTGALVGSGAAWQAVKQVGEWTGASGVLGTAKDYWFGKAEAPTGQKEIAWKGAEKAIPLPEEPTILEMGARGPQGALLDEFKKNPELAKRFFGGDVTTEELGAKVHLLLEDQAKQALANPETLAEMKKLGFPLNAEGYAKMAHRIGKGVIQIDPTGKNIKFADLEYLKNVTKEVKTFVDQPTPKEIPAIGVEDLLKKGGYHFEGHDKLKFPDFDLAEANRIIDADTLQKMMETPGGKLGGILSKLPSTDHKNLISLVSKTGGWNKFMDMPAASLFPEDGAGVTDIGFTKLGYALKEVTGDAPMLHGAATIREVLDSIKAKEIFVETAKEIMEKTK